MNNTDLKNDIPFEWVEIVSKRIVECIKEYMNDEHNRGEWLRRSLTQTALEMKVGKLPALGLGRWFIAYGFAIFEMNNMGKIKMENQTDGFDIYSILSFIKVEANKVAFEK